MNKYEIKVLLPLWKCIVVLNRRPWGLPSLLFKCFWVTCSSGKTAETWI